MTLSYMHLKHDDCLLYKVFVSFRVHAPIENKYSKKAWLTLSKRATALRA